MGNLAIKVKMEIGGGCETDLVPCTWETEYSVFGVLPVLYIAGFKGRKMDEFTPDRKNTTIIEYHLINQSVKNFLAISGLRIRFPPIH